LTAPKLRVVSHGDSAGTQPQTKSHSDGLEWIAVPNLPDARKPNTLKTFHVLVSDASRVLAEDRMEVVRAGFRAQSTTFTAVLGDSTALDQTLPAYVTTTHKTTRKSVALISPRRLIPRRKVAPAEGQIHSYSNSQTWRVCQKTRIPRGHDRTRAANLADEPPPHTRKEFADHRPGQHGPYHGSACRGRQCPEEITVGALR
jgi:hypothetical protein